MAAHPYEINRDKFHVDFAAIARALAAWRTTLDDLLALANAEHRDSVEIVQAEPDDEIRDLVDLVIFGTANVMNEMAASVSDQPYHWQRRGVLYARLGELRTSLGARAINDPEVAAVPAGAGGRRVAFSPSEPRGEVASRGGPVVPRALH